MFGDEAGPVEIPTAMAWGKFIARPYEAFAKFGTDPFVH